MNKMKHVVNEIYDQILADRIVSIEFLDLFLGDYLGSGCYRHVFIYRLDPRYVVKIDVGNTNSNVMEFNVWQSVRYMEIKKWFAPITHMTKCGRVMLQRRVNQPCFTKYPKEIPHFFTDIKHANFGFIGKQFVCVDYAGNLLMENGMKDKMKKVKTWV